MKNKKTIEKPYELLKDPKRGRLILIALLIMSLIFVPTYYMSMSKSKDKEKVLENKIPPIIAQQEKQEESNKNIENDTQEGEDNKGQVVSSNEFDSESFEKEAIETLIERNANEVKKVQDFVDIKANRRATLELIEESIEIKEKLYSKIIENKSQFDPDTYIQIENATKMSLDMSKEFSKAFDSKTTIGDLKRIVKKYIK